MKNIKNKKNKNKFPRTVLTLLVFLMNTVNVFALSGSGTPEDPYRIGSYYDFRDFGYILIGYQCTANPGAWAVQTGDVWTTAYDFPPLGFDGETTVPYTGTYDGQGHEIKINPYIGNTPYCALFGHVSGGTVKNIVMLTPSYSTSQDNAYCSAIAGILSNGATIENCIVYGPGLHATGNNSNVGVFVGTYEGTGNLVKDCYFYDSNNQNYEMTGTTGSGLTLTNSNRMFEVFFSAYVTTSAPRIFYYSNRSYYERDVEMTLVNEGYVADYYTVNNVAIEGNSFILTCDCNVNAVNLTIDPTHFSQDDDDTYTIHTNGGWNVFCDALKNESTYHRFEGKTVNLDADIATSRTASGMFAGIFDGNGHTLNVDLFFNSPNEYCGPFAYLYNGTIQNLAVTGSVTTVTGQSSGLVGYCNHTTNIINCHVSTIITCTSNDSFCGGILGRAWGDNTNEVTTITGCVFDGKLLTTSGAKFWGGIVGQKGGNGVLKINNCLYAPAALGGNETEATTSSGTFCTNDPDENFIISNSYYTRTLGKDQGIHAHSIKAGLYVTMDVLGDTTHYAVGSVSFIGSSFLYRDVVYAGPQYVVNLNLANAVPPPYTFTGYTSNTGTLSGTGNPYTLTMTDADVTINVSTVPYSLTICEGTGSNQFVPFAGNWASDSEQEDQMIYPASELTDMVGKYISYMVFYVDMNANNGPETDPEFLGIWKVSLAMTTKTSLTAIDHNIPLTKVYEGYLDCSTGTLILEFDNEFYYTGDNLLVDFYHVGEKYHYNAWYFYGVSAPGASYAQWGERNFLPQITFLYSNCLRPRNASVDYTGGTEAIVNCTSDATTLNIKVNGIVTENITVPYNLTGLDYLTDYEVKFQSSCGGNEYSIWSDPVHFRTECGTKALPYSFGFEADIEFTDCWRRVDCADGSTATTEAARSGSKGFTFSSNNKPAQYLISPELTGTEDGVQVTFYYKQKDAEHNAETFTLGYSTNTDDIDAFTWNTYTVSTTADWAEYYGVFPTGTKYIAVKYYNNNVMYIDDFSFMVAPDCVKPTYLAYSDVTNHAVTLNWISDANAWQVCINDDEDHPINVTENPCTLTNLSGETEYTMKVRTNCGSEVSPWSNAVSFTTYPNCFVPTGLTTTRVLPKSAVLNWTRVQDSYNVRYRIADEVLLEDFENSTLGEGWTTYQLYKYSGIDNGKFYFECDLWNATPPQSLISPELTSDGTCLLRFNYSVSDFYYTMRFRVGFSSLSNSMDDFVWEEEIQTNAESWKEYSITIPEGTKFFAIQYLSDNTGWFMIDDIGVYGGSNSGPWVTFTTQANTDTLTGLQTETHYQWQVQGIHADCDGDVTEWSGLALFKTRNGNLFIHDGNWNDGDNWLDDIVPSAGLNVFIFADAVIPSGYTVEANEVYIYDTGSILIKDGGQLVCNTDVWVTMEIDIEKYQYDGSGPEAADGWYFIAPPVEAYWGSIWPYDIPGLTSNVFDLYRLEDNVWQNFKSVGNDFRYLYNSEGYLYANSEDVTLSFSGYALSLPDMNDTWPVWKGWCLIGNPYPCNVYADRVYYRMNSARTDIEAVESYATTPITPGTGILVYGDTNYDRIRYSREAPSFMADQGHLQISVAQSDRQSNSTGILDKAIVSFNEGSLLPKFRLFNNATIYIPQDSEDYAILYAEKQGELPVNFEAEADGEYTISVNFDQVWMDYLHLIDNLTGADIDLLATPSYTFESSTSDYASRFRLVFSVGDDNGSGNFAFTSGREIIIKNAAAFQGATLQVIDMLGHVILSRDLIQRVSTTGLTPGVYVLRLLKGDVVRTQKIVIQ